MINLKLKELLKGFRFCITPLVYPSFSIWSSGYVKQLYIRVQLFNVEFFVDQKTSLLFNTTAIRGGFTVAIIIPFY